MFSRREFLAAMMAGGAVVAGELWIPGQKLISIPSRKIFIPEGTLAWMEDGQGFIHQKGKIIAIPEYFDIDIHGALTSQAYLKPPDRNWFSLQDQA